MESSRYQVRDHLTDRRIGTSAVNIEHAQLLFDTTSQTALLRLQLQNVSSQPISQITIRYIAYDVNGVLTETNNYTASLNSVGSGQSFELNDPILLQNASAAFIETLVIGVVFADGTFWNATEAEITAAITPPSARFQQTASTQQQNPYTQQQSPYMQQQNPYAQQQSPYMQQQNPYAQQQSPYMQQQNPYAQQQSPYMQQQNPYTQQQNPYMQQMMYTDPRPKIISNLKTQTILSFVSAAAGLLIILSGMSSIVLGESISDATTISGIIYIVAGILGFIFSIVFGVLTMKFRNLVQSQPLQSLHQQASRHTVISVLQIVLGALFSGGIFAIIAGIMGNSAASQVKKS